MAENYIAQLDTATPPGSAFISTADETFRTIKTAVKSSFPSVNGAVTLTHTQINALPTDITSAQTALKNTLDPHGYTSIAGAAAATVVPKGGIIMWAPSVGSIPSGWRLCDGGTYNGVVTPDLRSRFVMCEPTGFSGTRAVAESITIAGGGHTHTVTVDGTGLTVSNLPDHQHALAVRESPAADNQPSNSTGIIDRIGNDGTSTLHPGEVLTNVDGGSGSSTGSPHTHTATTGSTTHSHTATGILPAHYILAFICYVGA